MSYDTWNWSEIDGTAMPGGYEAIRRDPLSRQETDAGYVQTAPEDVRGSWIFRVEFSVLRPWSYIYLVNFYHAHRGGSPFYFRWPWGLFGTPSEYGTASPGGVNPWDSEIVPGFGQGPTHLVYWDQDQFPVRRLRDIDNYWQTSGTIELRQC